LTIPKVPYELTQGEWSRIYTALKDGTPYQDRFNKESDWPNKEGFKKFRDERKKENAEIAGKLVQQLHAWRRANTTKDDAGVVHLLILDPDPKHTRIFTYTCDGCAASMSIESDNGHLAVQYWRENHKCQK
jgi:hypothetical protein